MSTTRKVVWLIHYAVFFAVILLACSRELSWTLSFLLAAGIAGPISETCTNVWIRD